MADRNDRKRLVPTGMAASFLVTILLACSDDGGNYRAMCEEARAHDERGQVTGTSGIRAVTGAVPDNLSDAADALQSALAVQPSDETADGEVPADEIATSMDRIDEGRAGAEALNGALAEHCGDGAPRIRFP